jgi:hypothetical protein
LDSFVLASIASTGTAGEASAYMMERISGRSLVNNGKKIMRRVDFDGRLDSVEGDGFCNGR